MRTDFPTLLQDKLASAQPGKNLFVSPFSIQVALAMCAVGAKGQTRDAIADLIGLPDDVEEQNNEFATILASWHDNRERLFQLVIANALWGQQGYRFSPNFKKTIAEFYGGDFEIVDFRTSPDMAIKTINDWVAEKTKARIKHIIQRGDVDDDTRLVLANAIYFKGSWEEPFEQESTWDENWQGPKVRKVPMMHQEGSYLYYEDSEFQALNLPYKGRRLSMLIVLPTKKDGLAALERRWASQASFRKVTDGFDSESVIVSMPRFKIEADFKLKPVLCALRADLPFSDDADFSGIGDEPLKISEVVHKAFVEVNEKGTEAAAATAVNMWLSAGAGRPAPEPKIFKADHPFMFYIWERKTNNILFSGRLLDPA